MEEYEYISTLGEGAYGHVWKCQERSTGRIVAIKGFKQAHEEPEIMRLAVREVRVLQTLHHPAVIQLIEAFKSKSGRVYMVFPYVGRSAYQELDRHPDGVAPHTLKLLVWQLLQALAYLHRKKVIHRDIKPANILLSEGGDVKLCDFGFARYVRCAPHEVQRLSSYVVTRWYRAPEVLVSDVYGPAADIWSLGCTVAELATGVPLFPGKSTVDQLWRIMRCFGPLPPRLAARVMEDSRLTEVTVPPPGRTLRERLPGCEPGLLRLVEACLAMDPNVRPTAEDLLQLPYFWVVPRLLAGTPLESVYDRMLQEPGGGGVCNGGVTKGPMEGGTTAAQREMLPSHSGGNAAQRGRDRSVAPPPLVIPPSGRTASSTAPPPPGSNTSGGGGTPYNAVPPSMPPTPDMWAPEQRPGQQSTAAPSTAVSSITPAAAASDDGTGSSNSSLLPMSPTDIGSPEHLGCASSTCSSEAARDALDEEDDDEGQGDRSVYDSASSCTTRASSDAESAMRPVRHVQLVADSPAHRHPPLHHVKQAQHPPLPSCSEQSAHPPAQQQQQELLLLQQQQLHQQLQQQLQQQQLQQKQQQQESRQQLLHPPQRPQRPSHRHIAHREQHVSMGVSGEAAATSGGMVVSAVQSPPASPPPSSQGLAQGFLGTVSGGSIEGHGTACTTVTKTSVSATTAISADAVSGVENPLPVITGAAAAASGDSSNCTATSAGIQPYGTGMGLAGAAGMEATGAELGAETVFQVQNETRASGGGGGGGAEGDVVGFAIGLGSGAVRSGGRSVGGTTLLSSAVSAASLAQLLDISGPLEPSSRLVNMDGGNGDGVNVASSSIVTADGMPYTVATGPSATPSIIMAGSAVASSVRDLCGGGGGDDNGAGGGRDDNELSLWPQSRGLLLLPHPSPPPTQSLQHQQGLVRVLTPEQPLPPPQQLAAATPSNNIDTCTTPAVSLYTPSDSLPSSRGPSSCLIVQHMQAAPPPLPPPPATTTTTSRVHLTGGASDTVIPMDITMDPVRFLDQSVSANRATPFAAWPPSAGCLPRTSGGMLPTLDSTVEPLEPSECANRGAEPGSTTGAISIAGGASRSMGVSSISRAALGISLPGCRSAMLSSWGGDPVAAGVSDQSPSFLISTGMPSIAGLSNVPSGHMGSCDTVTFAQLCVASPSAVAAGPPAPNPHGGGGGAGAAPRRQQGGAVPGISAIAGGGSSYVYGYDRPMHLGVSGSPSYSSYMLKAGGSCSGYSEAALPFCTTPDGPVAAKTRSTMAAYSTPGEDERATAGAFPRTANLSVGRGGAAAAGSSTGFRSYQNHPHILSSGPMPPSKLEAARTAAALAAPAPAVVAARSFRNMSMIARESTTSTGTPRRMGASYTGMPYAPMTSLPEVDTAIIGATAGAVVHEASHSSAGFRSGSGAIPSAAVIAAASSSGIGAGGDEWVLALDTGDPLASNGPGGSGSVGAPRVAARSTSRSLLLGGSNNSKVQPIPGVVCRSRSRSRFGSTLQAASSGSFAIAAVSVAAAGGGIGIGADGGISPLRSNVCSTADGALGVGSGAVGATASELLRRQSSLWAVASSSLRSHPSIGEAIGSNSAAVAAIGDIYDNACTTSPSGVVLLGNRRLTRGEEGEGVSLGVGWSSGGGASLGGDGGSGRSSKKNNALSKLLRVMKKALSFK